MSIEPLEKPQHLILIRGMDWDKNLSPEQIQDTMGRFRRWVESIDQSGLLVTARPLAPAGKVISGANGATIADGPFAELKEAVGGYFLVETDMDKAMEIAQACPALEHGAIMEVRPVLNMCPMMEEAERLEREKHAAAAAN